MVGTPIDDSLVTNDTYSYLSFAENPDRAVMNISQSADGSAVVQLAGVDDVRLLTPRAESFDSKANYLTTIDYDEEFLAHPFHYMDQANTKRRKIKVVSEKHAVLIIEPLRPVVPANARS